MSRQAIVALEREGGRPQAPNASAIAAELGVDVFDLWPLEEGAQAPGVRGRVGQARREADGARGEP
jgi:DNA-binding XRE family transcriptional regulator